MGATAQNCWVASVEQVLQVIEVAILICAGRGYRCGSIWCRVNILATSRTARQIQLILTRTAHPGDHIPRLPLSACLRCESPTMRIAYGTTVRGIPKVHWPAPDCDPITTLMYIYSPFQRVERAVPIEIEVCPSWSQAAAVHACHLDDNRT